MKQPDIRKNNEGPNKISKTLPPQETSKVRYFYYINWSFCVLATLFGAIFAVGRLIEDGTIAIFDVAAAGGIGIAALSLCTAIDRLLRGPSQ